MPAPQIKSLAKQSGKSEEEVEKEWNRIKAGLLRSIPEDDHKFYPLLVASVKYKIGLIKKSNRREKPNEKGKDER